MHVYGDFELVNMKIRDDMNICQDEQGSTVNFYLEPEKTKIVILDAIDRHKPYSFLPRLEFDRILINSPRMKLTTRSLTGLKSEHVTEI